MLTVPSNYTASGSGGGNLPPLAIGAVATARQVGQGLRVATPVGVGLAVVGNASITAGGVEFGNAILGAILAIGGALRTSRSDLEENKPVGAVNSSTTGNPNPEDPCGKQSFKDLGSNSRADSAAQRAQFEDAHAFKSQYVGSNGSQFNMVIDKVTGRIWLEPLRGGPSIPTEYDKTGDYIGERKPEEGKC